MALFSKPSWLWAAAPALLMTFSWNSPARAAETGSGDGASDPATAGVVVPTAYRMSRAQYSPQDYTPCPPQTTQPAPAPAGAQPAPGTSAPPPEQPFAGIDRAAIEAEQFGGLGGQLAVNDAPGGYIDSAIVGNVFRFRFDAAFDDTRPDRAEFIYAKCGCFRDRNAGAFFDPNAKGPGPNPESRIDYQEFRGYLELAISDRLSGFMEVPIRLLEAVQNANHQGVGDINAGFKYALVACPDRYLTFQLRVYAPTGDSFEGLGTGHTSLEPGILLYRRLGPRLSFQGELKDWIPIGGSDFAGNVLEWGVGLGYDLIQPCSADKHDGGRLTAVAELVGWDVLSGKESAFGVAAPIDAAGETIVNLKIGPRLSWQANSLYCGWGHALTEDAWYRDMLRVEFSRAF